MENTINYSIKCTVCRQWKTVKIKEEEFKAWDVRGVAIQKAMPNLNEDDRELLISQTCKQCYDQMFES